MYGTRYKIMVGYERPSDRFDGEDWDKNVGDRLETIAGKLLSNGIETCQQTRKGKDKPIVQKIIFMREAAYAVDERRMESEVEQIEGTLWRAFREAGTFEGFNISTYRILKGVIQCDPGSRR